MSESNDILNQLSESEINESAAATTLIAASAAAESGDSNANNTKQKSFLPTLQKASGLRPPTSLSISTQNLNTTAGLPTPGGTSRIGRPCQGHTTPKAGLPPPPETKQQSNSVLHSANIMRRQSDEFSRSQLADVDEECEADLTMERRNNFSRSSRTPEMNNYVTSKPPKPDGGNGSARKISISSDHYLEATGRRRSSDQGVVLTTDTDSFIIGQRVWVGGIRPGQIAYIGETHFAPGEWAGIVLDEPNGKNDGCVSGKRYFQCEPKKGIFSRLTRLTHEPLSGSANMSGDVSPLDQSMRSLISPSRSTTVSPPGSVRSVTPKSKSNMTIGDRVIVSSGLGSRPGLLKFLGETKFAPGTWCGVQLDEATGKNDGSVDNVSYFECPPKYGIFVPLAKVTLSPSAKIANRLSRAGSRESLASVGTVGSVQSTATSRMRMSAQRLSTSSSTKPLTAPKTTFSLQDVLREKQNHIEQLLIERDLERQESENQVFMFQKDIAQLKNQIVALERQLVDERKKSEDLQFSIDEATFCKEESNQNSKSNFDYAQTQEYKCKIEQLEKQLSGSGITDINLISPPEFDHDGFKLEMENLRAELNRKDAIIQQSEILQKTMENEIIVLREKQVEAAKTLELKVDGLNVSEQALQDEIVYLKTQVDDLRMELNGRNEAIEKQYLNMKEVESTIKEELDLAQFELKEKTAIIEEHEKEIVKLKSSESDLLARDNELEQNEVLIQALQGELKELNALSATIKSEKEELNNYVKRLSDEKQLVENELKILKSSSTDINSEILKLSNELRIRDDSYQKLNNETENMRQQLETKIQELQGTLTTKTDEYNQMKSGYDAQLHNSQKDLERTKVECENVSRELAAKVKDLENLNAAIKELNGKLDARDTKWNELIKNYSQLELDMGDVQRKYESNQVKLNQILEQKKAVEKELEQVKNISLDSNSEVSRLSSDLKSKQDSYNKLFDESNSIKLQLEKQIHELQQNLTNRSTEVDQLNQNIAELLDQKSNLDTDLAKVKETAENDRITLRSEMDAVRSEKEKLLNQFNDRTKESEKQAAALTEVSAKLEITENKLNELNKTYSQLELDFGDLLRRAEASELKLSQILEQKQSAEMELSALRNSSLDINSEISRLSTELKTKKDAYNRLFDESNGAKQNLEKEIHEVKQNLNLKSNEFSQLQSQYNELLSIKSKLEEELAQTRGNLELEKTSLKVDIESMQLQKDSLLAVFNTTLKENEALLTQIAELTNRLEATENKLNEITKTYSKLELEHGDLSRKAESNEIKLNQIVEQKQTIESELETIKSSSLDTSAEVLRISGELKSKQEAYNQLFDSTNETKFKLEKEVHEAQQNLALKSQEFDTLKNGNESLSQSKAKLDEEVGTLRSTLDEERNHFKMEIEKMSSQMNKLTEELSQKYAALQLQFGELQVMHEADEIQIKQLTEQKLAVEQDLESIRNCNIDSNAEFTRISNELKSKQEAYTQLTNTSAKERGDFEQQIRELQISLNSKVTEIEALSKLKIKNENELNNELIQLKEISDNEKLQLDAELEKLRNEKAKLIHEIEQKLSNSDVLNLEMNSSIGKLENQLAELQKELEISRTKLTESTQTSDQVINELKLTEARLKESLKQTEEMMSAEKKRLEKELELKNEKLQLLQDENVDIVNQNSELLSKINLSDDMKNELLTHQQEILKLNDNAKRFESHIATLETDNRKLKSTQSELNQLKLIMSQKDQELKVTKDKVLAQASTNFEDDTVAQIAFLNSIIADMQKKNDSLIEKLALLESGLNGPQPNLFEMPGRRKPAPRLFCDICDEFDSHDTEDCPLQSSESPPAPGAGLLASSLRDPNVERKIPPPRKYCELCEIFGHDVGECENDETY